MIYAGSVLSNFPLPGGNTSTNSKSKRLLKVILFSRWSGHSGRSWNIALLSADDVVVQIQCTFLLKQMSSRTRHRRQILIVRSKKPLSTAFSLSDRIPVLIIGHSFSRLNRSSNWSLPTDID